MLPTRRNSHTNQRVNPYLSQAEEDLSSLTVTALKDALLKEGLSVAGKKATLIERFRQHVHANPNTQDETSPTDDGQNTSQGDGPPTHGTTDTKDTCSRETQRS